MEESMKDYEEMLERSYSLMGDGVHDTDALLAWKKAEELQESQENIIVTVSEVVKGGVVADFEGIRAFIPISKLSIERIENCDPYLDKEIEVRVFEANMDEDKLNLAFGQILRRRLYGLASGRVRVSEEEEHALTDMPFFVEYADERW